MQAIIMKDIAFINLKIFYKASIIININKSGKQLVSKSGNIFMEKFRQITSAYDCVCIEDLNMKGMSQVLNFRKSVADNGFVMFTTFLNYKL